MNARELVQTLMGLDPETELSVLVDRDGTLEFRPVGGIERGPSGEVVLVEDNSIDVDQARVSEEVVTDLEAIKARLAAAIPGPWYLDKSLRGVKGQFHDYPVTVVEWAGRAEATLIAHAPGDIAALVAEVERLRDQSATFRRLLAEVVIERDALQEQIEAATDAAFEADLCGE